MYFKKLSGTVTGSAHKGTPCYPDGGPDHIYNFPEEYGLEECGKHVFPYRMLFSFSFLFLQWGGVGWGMDTP